MYINKRFISYCFCPGCGLVPSLRTLSGNWTPDRQPFRANPQNLCPPAPVPVLLQICPHLSRWGTPECVLVSQPRPSLLAGPSALPPGPPAPPWSPSLVAPTRAEPCAGCHSPCLWEHSASTRRPPGVGWGAAPVPAAPHPELCPKLPEARLAPFAQTLPAPRHRLEMAPLGLDSILTAPSPPISPIWGSRCLAWAPGPSGDTLEEAAHCAGPRGGRPPLQSAGSGQGGPLCQLWAGGAADGVDSPAQPSEGVARPGASSCHGPGRLCPALAAPAPGLQPHLRQAASLRTGPQEARPVPAGHSGPLLPSTSFQQSRRRLPARARLCGGPDPHVVLRASLTKVGAAHST